MAPGFPTTFEKEKQSPLTPSGASGSNTPISYKANVNRNKTKKWADAKPVDYGGDDWGEDDDYDPPPPVSKPTGLRQQGQGLQSGLPSTSSPIDKKNYGELPPLPGPGPNTSRPRLNSFDADDEKRTFSNTIQLSGETTPKPLPATRFSQITGRPSTSEGPPALSITTQQLPPNEGVTGLRKVSQIVSPVSGSPHPDIVLPGPGPGPGRANTGDSSASFSGPRRVNTGESGSIYSQPSDVRTPSSYQGQRDFSPTAVPAPLSTTRSVPPSAVDTPSAMFPARKSSLSQSTGPDLAQIITPAQDIAGHKPWAAAGRSSSPSASLRSPISPSGKALPFIRPADIYRRVEEEKERERQSMDSGRPSMDSLSGAKPSDRFDISAKPLREKTSSDSLGSRQWVGDDNVVSGRHLQPMLEPVKERKSEYGFEGFHIEDQAAKVEATDGREAPSEHEQLSIQRVRSSSVSPKLPDLNRMSGFGLDLFSPSVNDEKAQLPLPPEAEATPALSNVISAQVEATTPGRQPSIGYRNAVNQAFERKDDSSVPQTPASQTESYMRRSDSESTGTAGISPIMSRAPNGAISDIRAREGAAPSILEVVHEPVSPVTEQGVLPDSSNVMATVIQPGHRRDTRTPTPGNSPAILPNVATTEATAQSHEDVLEDPLSVATTMQAQSSLAPRPVTQREESFRPSLPGGWTSYATTARSETPQQDSTRASKEIDRTQTPTSQILSAHEQHDVFEHEITSKIAEHSFPQSVIDAAGEAPLAGGVVAASKQTLSEDSSFMTRDDTSSREGPAKEPSRNLELSTKLDPQLIPKFENVSPEAQLHPTPGNTEVESGDIPSTSAENALALDNPKDFSITVPSKERILDQVGAAEGLETPSVAPVLPTLSTDTRPQDAESDKLREEIIQSLSPQTSQVTPRNDSLQPEQIDDAAVPNDGRFSYLPREYDNYWATSSEEIEPALPAEVEGQNPSNHPLTDPIMLVKADDNVEITSVPPLSVQRTGLASDARPPAPHRFSWETSAEDVSLAQSREEVPPVPRIPSQKLPQEQQAGEVLEQTVEADTFVPSSSQPEQDPYSQYGNMDYDKELGAQGLTSPISEPSDDGHAERGAILLAGAAALGGTAAATTFIHSNPIQVAQQSQPPQRSLSLAEGTDPHVISHTISPTPPPEDGYLSRLRQADPSDPSTELPIPSAVPGFVSPINSPVQPQFPQVSKILAFKEITDIKSPDERIRTFDLMRQRFATMDSGLFNWMTDLRAQHPEHATATGSFNGNALNISTGPTGAKHAKAGGQQLPPLQQPYYQQYLNASPSAPGTPASRAGPSTTPIGSQQGFSPAGGKLKSQQVQAKGKELLHTAGIFGGKAGKAGKGLLAKGKNKLRGSGAGDKVD